MTETEKEPQKEYYINESGLQIDATTGELYKPSVEVKQESNSQCLPP